MNVPLVTVRGCKDYVKLLVESVTLFDDWGASMDHFCIVAPSGSNPGVRPPQGDYQFARQGNDHGAADAPPLLEPARETAMRLVAQAQPGKLRWRFAAARGLLDLWMP